MFDLDFGWICLLVRCIWVLVNEVLLVVFDIGVY